MKKRIITILCTGALIASALSGCGSSKQTSKGVDDNSPITLTYYDQNISDAFGNDDVSKEIIAKTGVTLNVQPASGDAKEKLNIMLASNSYPDILLIGRSTGMIDKFINAKAIVPLDDLVSKYGPDIKSQYGDIWNKARNEDGKVYGLPNWYGMDDSPVLSFLIRQDLLSQFAPAEEVNGDKYIGQDEFLNYLKQFKEKNPTIEGKPAMPMTLWAENWGSLIGSFKGMYGLKNYYEKDGNIYYDFRDPQYKDMLKYINTIYRDGLLDNEWPINKQQLWNQKLAAGNVFSTVEAFWNVGDANKVLSQSDTNKMFMPYKVVANGIDPTKTTYSGRNPLGWDIVCITSSNKNPERSMKFLNYLASDEGQKLIMSGVQGKEYELKDGKRVMSADAINEMKKDGTAYQKRTGARRWTICVKNGNAEDGDPYAIQNKYNDDKATLFSLKTIADTIWDVSPYDNLNPPAGSPDALVYQKISDKSLEYCTKLIMANSEAEFEQLWSSFMSEVNSIGAEKMEKIFTDAYTKQKKLWGE